MTAGELIEALKEADKSLPVMMYDVGGVSLIEANLLLSGRRDGREFLVLTQSDQFEIVK